MEAAALTPTWQAYHAVTERIMQARGELAETQAAEREARMQVIVASTDGSISGRDREADVATAHYWTQVVKMKAAIAADEDLRDYLTTAIAHGIEVG